MVELNKQPKPEILKEKGNQWTQDLMSYVHSDKNIPENIGGRYRHDQIKTAVKLETSEKCAYCECKVTHQYPGDVEHIIPKSAYRRLTFIWGNLSFVCYWCNNHKRDFIDKSCKLLNPYRDQIDLHLQAFGPLIMHINQSKRGELTWREIKLNRKELIDRRTEELEDLQNLIDKYEAESSSGLKELLRQELISCTEGEAEFSFVKKQYLIDRNIL